MKNKPLARLLSVILTIAICATTVFGCLISVNAADTPSYVIQGATCKVGDTVASATATFTVPDGTAGGQFKIDNTDGWYQSVEVSFCGELLAETDNVNIDTYDGTVLFNVTDEEGDAKLYTTVVLKLDFVFKEGGITDTVQIKISDVEFGGLFESVVYTSFANNSTDDYFSTGCRHEFVVDTDSVVYSSTEDEYTVYSAAVCSKCGEAKDGYQVVPEVEKEDSKSVSIYTGSDATLYLKDETQPNTESNPYMINTANQMYSFLIMNSVNSAGEKICTSETPNYFKVSEDISAFYMNGGNDTVATLTTTEQVSTYFTETNTSAAKIWSGDDRIFTGHFDGSGVEIYGLKSDGNRSGLFTSVKGNVTIKNIIVKNSYFSGGIVGGIVARTVSNDTSTVTIENCAVINCCMYATTNGANAGVGSLIGQSYQYGVVAKNILIYGNDYNYIDGYSYGLVSYGRDGSQYSFSNIVSIGYPPYRVTDLTTGTNVALALITNSAFSNVYTDLEAKCAGYWSSQVNYITYAENEIKQLTKEQMQGSTAATTASGLDWNTSDNTDGVWFVGKTGEYPSLLKGFEVAAADSTSDEWELIAANIEYLDSGNFNLNFHFIPPTYADAENTYLYVPTSTQAESGKFQKIKGYTDSSSVGKGLSEDAMMFTIPNLSARDIDIVWLPTIVTMDEAGETVLYGNTQELSVEEYATQVVLGNATYVTTTDETKKELDKDVAAALINYGHAADDALSITTVDTGKAVTWKGWASTTFDSGTGAQNDPFIISNAEQLQAVALGYVESKDADGNPYYFKVADGIKAFYMNGGAKVAGYTSADDVETYFTTDGNSKTNWGYLSSSNSYFKSDYFYGNFDGNGATVYGLYSTSYYAALFPRVSTNGNVAIKNITVKNSYFACTGEAGGIFAYTDGSKAEVNIENCTVGNCYISGNNVGAIGGHLQNNSSEYWSDGVLVSNCLVYGNTIENTSTAYQGRLFGYCQPWRGDADAATRVKDASHFCVKNTVAIGCSVYNANSYWEGGSDTFPVAFVNCYSDTLGEGNDSFEHASTAGVVEIIDTADAQGTNAPQNMPLLDWDNTWIFGANGQYPSLAKSNNSVSAISEYTGNPPTSLDAFVGSGTDTDPYIVETADQFAAIAQGKVTTSGLYFKVADGVEAFYINGGAQVAALSSADEVKEWFTAHTYTDWANPSTTTAFRGNFDGNGATVYGLYDVSGWYVGLFPMTGEGAVISNITLKNSYLSGNGFVGGIVGSGYAEDSSKYDETTNTNLKLTLNNIEVIDNVITCNNGDWAYGGVVIAYTQSYAMFVTNCIAYGNITNYTNSTAATNAEANGGMPLFGYSGATDGTVSYNRLKNIISIGHSIRGNGWWINSLDKDTYQNVYSTIVTNSNNTSGNMLAHNVNLITPEDMQGLSAKETTAKCVAASVAAGSTQAADFDWGTTWYTGAYNDYPSFNESTYLTADLQSEYDALTLTSYDSYGDSTSEFGVYTTALSLKANPYISFAFAFHGDYKTNRDKIQVRFTYTVNGTETTTDPISPPAYVDGEEIRNVDGWTNTKSAGRYHTYKAVDIPVEALANGIKVEASYDGGEYVNFGTFSAEGLALEFANANKTTPSDYYATRVEAAKALLFYTQMLHARYGSEA